MIIKRLKCMAQQSSGFTMIDDLYKLIEMYMYLRTVRSQITTFDPKVEQELASEKVLRQKVGCAQQ